MTISRKPFEIMARRALAKNAVTAAVGCICPPTCERTCKNPTCPRQDHRTLAEKMRHAEQRTARIIHPRGKPA